MPQNHNREKIFGDKSMKKIVMATIISVATLTMFVGTASAAWFACSPEQIGPKGSIVRGLFINCTNELGAPATVGKNNNGWCTLNTTAGTDQQLAVILTAISLGSNVSIEILSRTDPNGYPIVESINLVNGQN